LVPKVTVIIVFLNEETYLSEATESVLNQTFHDWELLLVDDGSNDKSTKIARELSERHPGRVAYLEHPGHANRGISSSRNLGLAHAKGQYIAFLDADDIWVPNKVEDQVAILDHYPEVALTFGRLHFFTADPDIPVPGDLAPLRVPSGLLKPPTVFRQSLIGDGGMLWTTGTILFRKNALSAVGAFEDSFSGLGDDAVVWLKIALVYPVYALDELLLHYRRHCRSSGIVDWRKHSLTAGWLKVMNWLYGYVQEQPEQVRQWAAPIVRKALFRGLAEETHTIMTAPAKSFVDRLSAAGGLWFSLLRRYPEISIWLRVAKLFGLVVGAVCSSLLLHTGLRRLWHTGLIRGESGSKF
jgi:glycosyltransferase involved in cell wall biosynthesis